MDRTGGVNGTDGSGGQGEASDVGCDLILTNTAKLWRPGAGGFAFDEDGYFTWLCAVPRGTVTGTLYYDGEEHQVTGAGYHDHQWGNVKHNSTWDHWIWGRQDFTQSDKKYDVVLGINGCNPMKKYKKLLSDNGVFVGVGDMNQAMKALMASFRGSC